MQGATQSRFWRALVVVVAAALSDTLLIVLAIGGVSVVVLTVSWVKVALAVLGAGFLLYIGWLTWRSNAAGQVNAEAAAWPLGRQILFALSVSLLNPHAILDTIGVIGASSLAYDGSVRLDFAAACILNSWLWFLGLALLGRLVGQVGAVRLWLNKASALIIWLSAGYLLFHALMLSLGL